MLRLVDSIAVVSVPDVLRDAQGLATYAALAQALSEAEANASVRGVVMTGLEQLRTDSYEFEPPAKILHDTELCSLLAQLEGGRKPVVAALAGEIGGEALALALASHGRVALASARIALPEVTLGVMPGIGSTQRLPRLVGPKAALDLMLSSGATAVTDLTAAGLLDVVVPSELKAAASRQASDLAAAGRLLPRARDQHLDVGELRAGVESRRAALQARQRMQPAYGAVLDAVEAGASGFDDGLRRELQLSSELSASKAARALHYQARAEREAVQLPNSFQAEARPVSHVAIIGAGTMGSGIAIAVLDAGLRVLLLEQDPAALERGRERIAEHYQGRVTAGKMEGSAASANEARLSTTTDWGRLSEADLVIEAVFEDLAVKQDVFRKIDRHARPGAVLATNTSYLDIDAIAMATSRPEDVLGLHFFSPANVMKLLEVVRGANTGADVLATGMTLGVRLKKTPVACGNAFGFIGNRIYNAYRRQCEFMLEDGAWPEDIDNALTAIGFAMGPFAVADLSGLDIAWRMRKSQAPTRDPRERYVPILDQLCEKGRLGRKVGAGYYDYSNGKQSRVTDASVRALIEQASATRGIARRPIEAVEIQRRALLAMVNEAALLLTEGVASRPADVDVVLVQGFGFPRWEGGPVFWARRQDRERLAEDLQRMASEAGHGFVLGNLDALSAR